MTWLLTILGPKLLGVLIDKAMKALERWQARRDLKESVRQEVRIASLKAANRALEWFVRGSIPPDHVRPNAPPAAIIHPPDADPGE